MDRNDSSEQYATKFPDYVEAVVLAAPANMLNMPPDGNGLFEDIEALLPKQYFDFSM